MLLGQRHTPSANTSEPGGASAWGVSVGGIDVWVGLGVFVGASVLVGVRVGVDVGVAVGLSVLVGLGVFVGPGVLVRVGVAVAVGVPLAVAVGVLPGAAVQVSVGVFVGQGVSVETDVGVGDDVAQPAKANVTIANGSNFLHIVGVLLLFDRQIAARIRRAKRGQLANQVPQTVAPGQQAMGRKGEDVTASRQPWPSLS